MPSSNDVGLSFVLAQLQENLSRQDDRLAEHMKATAAQGAVLESVSSKVENLIKTVSTGNGQPALLVQVHDLRNDIGNLRSSMKTVEATVTDVAKDVKTMHEEMKAKHASLQEQLSSKYTPAQKTERWKAWGVIATATASLLVSILALMKDQL